MEVEKIVTNLVEDVFASKLEYKNIRIFNQPFRIVAYKVGDKLIRIDVILDEKKMLEED